MSRRQSKHTERMWDVTGRVDASRPGITIRSTRDDVTGGIDAVREAGAARNGDNDDAGSWYTLHHVALPVFVQGGRVVRGPTSLHGARLDDLQRQPGVYAHLHGGAAPDGTDWLPRAGAGRLPGVDAARALRAALDECGVGSATRG